MKTNEQQIDLLDLEAATPVKRDPIAELNRRTGNQGGATILVEYGLYLLLAVALAVGYYAIFGSNSTDTESQNLASEMTAVAGKVKSGFAGNYGAVSNTVLHSNGYFLDRTSLVDSNGTVTVVPGGGNFTAEPGQLTNPNDAVQYTVTSVPALSCSTLVSAFGNSAGEIMINGDVIKAVGGSTDQTKINCTSDDNTFVVVMS
jgi:hypothetical protein